MPTGWRLGYPDVAAAIAALAGNAAIGRVDSVNTTGAKLTALGSATFGEGALVWVSTVHQHFVLQQSALTTDNITCVAASGKPGYQWVRLPTPQPYYWGANFPVYVDPVSGSDENTGLVGFPLKTFAELYRRTRRAQLSGSITINILSDVPDGDDIVLDCDPFDTASAATITLQGQVTVAATAAVTAAQAKNAATNLANQITTVADLSAQVGNLLRVQGTSNYAAITKAVAAGTLRLGELFNTTTFANAGGVTGGQTIEVVTLTKGPLRVTNLGKSAVAAQDIRFDGTGSVSWTDTRTIGTYIVRRVIFGGTSSTTIRGNNLAGGHCACVFRQQFVFSGGALSGPNLLGGAALTAGASPNSCNSATKMILNGFVFQGQGLQVASGSLRVTGDLGTFDIAAGKIGIDIPFDSIYGNVRFTTGRHYGSGNNATSNVWAVNAMNQFTYLAAQPPTCDAGNGVSVVGVNTPLGSLPVALSTTNGAGVFAI